MQTPFRNKAKVWASTSRGVKSRFRSDVKKAAIARDDIPDVQVTNKIKRGSITQELRLRFYPTIDVDKEQLFAGEIIADYDEAKNRLLSLGFRNNPTAYVEVTEEHGPDDGSFSKQFITEDGSNVNHPQIVNRQPAVFKRLKEQYHVVLYDVKDRIIFLCHKEVSAWLQPARHVWKNRASARIGVRDFRDMWFDEFEEEMPGKENVLWDTTH